MKTQETHIQLLPPELSNQIAAGEVVERPSSVLKELVENSLDAEASSISAMIEDGGQTCIRVSDNGKGIPKEELSLAVTRHATSKIKNISDLSLIQSFGFRGEALPSIASVSRFCISSFPSSLYGDKALESQAYALEVEFGEHKPIYPVSLTKGTQIEVRDLFTNIPARLKFLKTPSTELKRAQEIFTRIGLIHTNKAFELFAGTREVVSFLANDSLHQRLSKVWAPSITQDMIDVDAKMYDDILISGIISNPRSLYAKADKLYLYVNGRPVSDKMLTRAVRQAYKDSLTTKDYPQLVLNIEINPEEVDVNVHPAKSEVRFRDEQRVFKAVYAALEKSLAKKLFFNQSFIRGETPIDSFSHAGGNSQNISNKFYQENQIHQQANPQNPIQAGALSSIFDDMPSHRPSSLREDSEFKGEMPFSSNENNFESLSERKPDGFWGVADDRAIKSDKHFIQADLKLTQSDDIYLSQNASQFEAKYHSESSAEEESSKNIGYIPQYLCQIASSYLLFQAQSGDLFVLDQHAVHERIIYERLSRNEKISVQHLLVPVELFLHELEVEAYSAVHLEIKKYGFDCELEENQKLIIKTLPTNFRHSAMEKFVREVLKNEEVDIKQKFMDAACDAALKAHQKITQQEAIELYKQWALCGEPDFCPHGRPCYAMIDEKHLAKLFKRI